MVQSIHPNQVMPRPLTPAIREGAYTTANKVTALVLAVFASFLSFVLLPVEGAFVASTAVLALLSMCCCNTSQNGPLNVQENPVRWYHRVAAAPRAMYGAFAPYAGEGNPPLRNLPPAAPRNRDAYEAKGPNFRPNIVGGQVFPVHVANVRGARHVPVGQD